MAAKFVALEFVERPAEEMAARGEAFRDEMARRRTTRHFSDRPVPKSLIEMAVATAGSAPSGAHIQPWTFVAVGDPGVKAEIRAAAEEVERETYKSRLAPAWRQALAPLGTDAVKEHITTAPWVVVVFKHTQRPLPEGGWAPTYYPAESVGIAVGLFVAAVHMMGLCTLTHTPSPMAFLRDILGRPEHETPYLLLPVGYPAEGAEVPDLRRKPLAEILAWVEGA